MKRLAKAATSVDGPIRMVVVDDPSLVSGLPVTQWPLSSVTVSRDEAITLGPGERNVLITDPAQIAKVVRIWEEYRSGAHGTLAQTSPIPFRDVAAGDAGPSEAGVGSRGHVYAVLIRDTIPLEDDRGLIPSL